MIETHVSHVIDEAFVDTVDAFSTGTVLTHGLFKQSVFVLRVDSCTVEAFAAWPVVAFAGRGCFGVGCGGCCASGGSSGCGLVVTQTV